MATEAMVARGLEPRSRQSRSRGRGGGFSDLLSPSWLLGHARAGDATRQRDEAQKEQPWRAPSFLAIQIPCEGGRRRARGPLQSVALTVWWCCVWPLPTGVRLGGVG
jgi:hypothetical protein